jgi:dynein heavy chain
MPCSDFPVLYQVSNDSLVSIFRAVLTWHLSAGNFPSQITQLAPQLVAATLQLYTMVSAVTSQV